jgi:peptide/nickel transport system permease protein
VSLPLLFFVTALTFFLVSLTPGDPALVILGPNHAPEEYARVREQLGLNQPLLMRYGSWLGDLLQGNLGNSIFNQEPVVTVLNGRLGVTLSLVIGTTLVSTIIGIGLGLAGAMRRGVLAKLVDTVSLLGFAIPNFWLALVLVAIFALGLRWVPAIGYVDPATSPGGWLQSLVLPVVVLSAPVIGLVAQQTRNAILEVLEKPFIRTLRAGGASRSSILFRHLLRSASIPIITVVGLTFIGLLSGTVIVETVFALPGLGGLAVQATARHDLPIIQGVVLYFTVIVIVVNLLVDLAYAWLNPKVRVS